MSDSIKRSDMILFLARRREHIRKHRKEYKTKREYDIADSVYCDILLALQSEGGIPSADRWTPVSEPPKEDGYYLVWMPYTTYCKITTAIFVDGYWNIKTPITAWAPLPEPYKDEYREVDVMEIEDLERGIYTVKKVVLTDDNMS